MRGISWFVHIFRDRSKLLRLKLIKLFPNINFSGEKDSGKVLIIIIILFLIIMHMEVHVQSIRQPVTTKIFQLDGLPNFLGIDICV